MREWPGKTQKNVKNIQKRKLKEYNTGAQTTRSNASFGPGRCGCSSSGVTLGTSCKSGLEKLKKNVRKIEKITFFKIIYRGPNNMFEHVVWAVHIVEVNAVDV